MLKAAAREMRSRWGVSRLYLESLIHVLAGHLIRRYTSSRQAGPNIQPKLSSQDLRLVEEYLDANLDQNLGIDKIAKIVGMGSHRLLAALRNTTGNSLHQYLILKRIRRAKELLARTDRNLAEIAFDLGFASQSHFGAVFNRLTSMTPGHYRKNSGLRR